MNKRIIGFALASLFTLSAFAQNDLQQLATVKYNKSKPETITLRQLKNRVNYEQKQYGLENVDVATKEKILDTIIAEKLISQAAASEGITISDSQVDATLLKSFSAQFGIEVTEAQLSDILKKQTGKTLDEYIKENSGMSLAEYKNHLRTQIAIQQYVFLKKQDELKSVTATDEEIKRAYELNRNVFSRNEMMTIFLVLVPKGNDSMEAKALCESMRNEYIKDKSKETIFKNSPDNNKKYNAGNLTLAKTAQQAQMLGWDLDKMEELFKDKEGYVSEVKEAPQDWEFYSIIKTYKAALLELSDEAVPGTAVTVYEHIKQNLTQQKISQYYSVVAKDLANSLMTKESVDRKKTGADLEKLLNW